MSDKPRLQIRPHGEGRFAVFEGEGLMVVADTLAEAEEAKKHWQRQIDAGGRPTISAGELAGIEVEALRAEIELLKREKNPRQHGRKGGEESGKSKRDAAPLRRAHAVKLIKQAVADKASRTRGEIVKWVLDKDHLKKRWEGLKPYRSSMIYDVISDLVRDEIIPEPPDPRK